MTEKQEREKRTLEMVKKWFNEKNLPILEEKVTKEGDSMLQTQINAESFTMFLQIDLSPSVPHLHLAAWFSIVISLKEGIELNDIIDTINYTGMDIGHFAFNTKDGGINFIGGVHILGEEYSAKQVTASLERFIDHGISCLSYLLRFIAPEDKSREGIENAVDEYASKFFKKRNTDISDMVKVPTKIEECFSKSGLVVEAVRDQANPNESGDSVRLISTVHGIDAFVTFRTKFWLDAEIIEVSMRFRDEWTEEILPSLLRLISAINCKSGPYYFTKVRGGPKIELRTAYLLSGEPFTESQFKTALVTFVAMGLYWYDKFRKLFDEARN